MAFNLKKARDFYNNITQNVIPQGIAHIASNPGLNKAANFIQEGKQRVASVPASQYFLPTANTPFKTYVQETAQGALNTAQSALKTTVPYTAYRYATGNPIQPMEYLQNAVNVPLGALNTMYRTSNIAPFLGASFGAIKGVRETGTTQGALQGAYRGIAEQPFVGEAVTSNPKLANTLNLAAIPVTMLMGGIKSKGNISALDKGAVLENQDAKQAVRLLKEYEQTKNMSIDWLTQARDILVNKLKIKPKDFSKLSNEDILNQLQVSVTRNQTYAYGTLGTNLVGKKDTQQSLYDTSKFKNLDEYVASKQPKQIKFQSAVNKADYMGGHEAPMAEGNAPIFDLTGKYTGNKIYPSDIYSSNASRMYSAGEPYDARAVSIMQSVKDRPNAKLTVYRAVPKEAPSKINPGDWISITRDYAKEHGESNLGGNYKIIKQEVNARDIFTDGNSIHEFGYDPQPRLAGEQTPYNLLKNAIEQHKKGKLTVYTNYLKKLEGEFNQPKNVAQGGLSVQPKGVNSSQTVEQLDRKLPQSAGLSTKQTAPQVPEVQTQTGQGGGQGASPTSPQSIDPVTKIINALKEAKPLREEQQNIYSKIRSQQAGALEGIGGGLKGEKGYYQKLGQLKGELPKVQFESIKKQVTQNDVDQLFNMVEKSNLDTFDKVNAQTGLAKLLGAEGGQVPTRGELNLLSKVFPEEFIQTILDKRPFTQKLFSEIEGTLNLPRAVMATADLSAPLRQGIFFVSRPKQFLGAFKNMFKYAFSEKAYQGLQDTIQSSPNKRLYKEAGLSITDMGTDLAGREEAFMTRLAEKIPGFGSVAKASNRAYSGFLNKLRVDVFDDLINKAKQENINLEGKGLKDLGSFINAATGRGDLPQKLKGAAPLLNGVFFSPRLIASRIQLLNPVSYANYSPFVRKEAIKSLLGFAGTATAVLTLAELGGATVVKDPRNADFGKIKIGNTRYDVLGGFQQYIRLISQLATGKIISSQTGKEITLGEGYKPLTRKDILLRFAEAKTAPVLSFLISLATGQTGTGAPVDVPTEVINRFIPLVAQDLYDITQEQGSKGLLMGIPGIFGVGTQTYGKQELVFGKNQIGQSAAQIRPVPGLSERISEKVFGQKPLGSTATYNAETYYNQMLKLPKEEAAKQFDQIAKSDPELAKKIVQVVKDRQKGITVKDQVMKAKGVASGDRAVAIADEFKKLKTKEQKARLWEEYVRKGIITKDVAKQLAELLKNQ